MVTNRNTQPNNLEKYLSIVSNNFDQNGINNMYNMMMRKLLEKERYVISYVLKILPYYKCSSCGKCCIECHPQITEDEIVTITKQYGNDVFNYLTDNPFCNELISPCHYLINNKCIINNIKPEVCKIYPFSLSKLGLLTICSCPMGDKIMSDITDYNKVKLSRYSKLHIEEATKKFQEYYNHSKQAMDIIKSNTISDHTEKNDQEVMCVPYEFIDGFYRYVKTIKR